MTAKFIMGATVTGDALEFPTVKTQLPAAVAATEANNFPPPSCKDTTTTSLIPILLLLRVNFSESLAANVCERQVITPEGAFKVTGVTKLVP